MTKCRSQIRHNPPDREKRTEEEKKYMRGINSERKVLREARKEERTEGREEARKE